MDMQEANLRLAKTIDTDLLLKGNGSAEHQHELYKVLALAGISTADLNDKNCMSIIQETLTDFIADGEMNEDDVEFAARSLAFQAMGGDRQSRDGNSINNKRSNVVRKHI